MMHVCIYNIYKEVMNDEECKNEKKKPLGHTAHSRSLRGAYLAYYYKSIIPIINYGVITTNNNNKKEEEKLETRGGSRRYAIIMLFLLFITGTI